MMRTIATGLVIMATSACGGKQGAAPTSVAAHGSTDEQAKHGHHGDHAEHGNHGGHTRHPHDHTAAMTHRFDDAERWAKVFDDPTRDAWQKPDEVVAALELKPGMKVADVGAGTGYFLERLAKAVGSGGVVIASDVEPNLVAHMQARAKSSSLSNAVVVLGTAADPKLGRIVDRVLIVDVWHHITDRKAFLGNTVATLAPGGKIMIVDFTKESPIGPPQQHRVIAEQIVQELSAAGLTATTVAETLPHQYIVVATKAAK